MDYFDDIAAIALGPAGPVSLVEAVEAYERDGVKRMIKLWKQFAVHLPHPVRERETSEPFQSPPELNWVKAYLQWRIKTGAPRLGERITVKTLLKEFQQLRRVLRLALQFSWDNKEIQVMKKYINDLSKTAGASTAMRHKSIAYALDSDEIQFYLWNCSERVYVHPRIMVQFSFWLHIVSVWGLRTGEIAESSSHRGSNEGIHYGDVSLALVRWQDTFRYQITIALRNRKFCRSDEGKVKKITLREHMDSTQRYRCPVRKFMALALADDVFVHQNSPEDFNNRWIRPTANSRSFEIKKDKTNLPIFRKLERNGRVSKAGILSATSSGNLLKEVCQECGYMEPVTTYTFRRGVANKVEANASQKGTKEVLSHKGDRTWHSYAAPTIGVDAQAIAYDEKEDTLFNEFAQSIALTRDVGAPKPVNASFGVRPIPSRDIVKAIADAHPNSRPEWIMSRARKEEYKLQREEYYKRARCDAVADVLADGHSTDEETQSGEEGSSEDAIPVYLRRKPTPEFKHVLKYNPLHARVIETLWNLKEASLAECVRPLMALADPEPFKVMYPSVLPPTEKGECPYCEANLAKLRSPWVALHLLDCHCITHRVRFCFDCAAFTTETPGTLHECPSFDPTSQLYGVILWRGLLIREGRCPYGSGRACGERRWRNAQRLQCHVDAHLEELHDGPLTCPHQTCEEQCKSKDDMRTHLHTTHKIRLIVRRNMVSKLGVPKNDDGHRTRRRKARRRADRKMSESWDESDSELEVRKSGDGPRSARCRTRSRADRGMIEGVDESG